MIVTQKLRIYPNKAQQEHLNKMFGGARFVYNKSIEAFKNRRGQLYYLDLVHEFPWLKETPVQVLQQSIRDFIKAKSRHFDNHAGWMKFKSKKEKQSVMTCLPSKKMLLTNTFKFPYIGKIKKDSQKYRYSGKLKAIRITKHLSGKYFASLYIETNQNFLEANDKTLGIDLGIKNFITDSDGNKIEKPKFETFFQVKIRKLQRKLSKCKVGGKNRIKIKRKLAKIHEKIVNKRNDFLHKLSYKLIRDNQSIVVEDLNIMKMMQKRKSNLIKCITNASWHKFIKFLQYKAEWYGRKFILVDPKNTSKTCSHCGYINENLQLKDRKWICSKCGILLDRDVNAAINILNRGCHGDSLLNISNLCNENCK